MEKPRRYRIFRLPLLHTGAVLAAAVLLAGCQDLTGLPPGTLVGPPDTLARPLFTNRDRILIEDYYANRRRQLPPGLAKRNVLPPGLQRQLVRNGQLPPGLRGRGLPLGLETRLSILPRPYERLLVGVDVVIMDARNRTVVDILRNVTN
jgi:hypothetical protein